MVHNIRANRRFLNSLTRAKGITKRIKAATDSQIKSVQELAHNILKKRIPLSKRTLVRLSPYKSKIKKLAAKSGSIKSKRKLLEQKGGAFWLAPLVSTGLSFLADQLLKN